MTFIFCSIIKNLYSTKSLKNKEVKATVNEINYTTFSSVKDALYWATNMMVIKREGGAVLSGMGISRDFEPIDVMIPLWRFIKNGNLPKDTENIIEPYCISGVEPSTTSPDFKLWSDVINKMKPILIGKKIVEGEKNDKS